MCCTKQGLIAQVRFNELRNLAVHFSGLVLLARWRSLSERDTSSSGRCGNEANQFSRSRTYVIY
jgi:hypothetical protein